jgi:hypothetical protein
MQMNYIIPAPAAAFAMFAGMLLFFGLGWRTGGKRQSGDGGTSAAIDGAIFGLFSLLVAFTFSGAAARFDERRKLIVEETNDIGTAYRRLDLLSPAEQPAARELLRKYLDARIESFRVPLDAEETDQSTAKYQKLQDELWKRALAATTDPRGHPDAAKLLLPALNAVFDITTTRRMAALMHPPTAIVLLLFGLGLASSFLVGSSMAALTRRGLMHAAGYAALTAITVFVIMDVEYPRHGFIRVDAYDRFLIELRQAMDEPR